MKILVIDVGGTNVKVKAQGADEARKFPSGPDLTPRAMLAGVRKVTTDWNYDHVTIGYPGPVLRGTVLKDPVNLGPGWLGFDFEAALKKPVRIVNDAVMQAIGSYEDGRMLFLGLGTGLGSCMILENVVAPMELGHLPYRKGRTFEECVGEAGLKRQGRRKWQLMVFDVVQRMQNAFLPDYIVLGGGNVKKLEELPPGCRPGDNSHAIIGGVRVWQKGAPIT